MRTVKRSMGLSLALVMALAVAACSAGKSNGDNGGGTKASKEITIASGADPVSLDPRKTWVGPGYSINSHIFEPLVFRNISGEKVELVGVLAEKFENVDPLTWKFTLRQGVKFHNGKPFNSDAVKFTYDTIMAKEFSTPLKTWLSDVDTVTTQGENVVLVKTKYPTRGLVSSLAQVPIVEPSAVKELGDKFNTQPVGTGPYKVDEYVPNNKVVVSKYAGYWGKAGTPDKITFRIMPENSTRLAALQAGEVALAEGLPPDKMSTIKSSADLDVVFTKTMRVDYLVLENDRKWMKDVKFRTALSLAIDRKTLVDTILGGTTIPASSVSPPGTVGFNDQLKPYEYNLEKAKALLAEAKYDGSPVKMGSPIGRYSMDKQMGEAIASMLKKAGVNVQLEALEWSSYIPKTDNDYDMWFIGQTDFTINPSKHIDNFLYSSTSEIAYKNPAMDTLLDEVMKTMDDKAAATMYRKMQEMAYTDMPIIPLYYEPQVIGVRKNLKGFTARLDEYVMMRDASLQ